MPGFLLTTADFYGTLAAARCLGARGIPVTMADDWPLAPGLWSRHVRRKLRAPRQSSPEHFVSWLLEVGRASPGDVLYPTRDELAWVFAARGEELSACFRTYQPGADVIFRLLDKRSLYEAAQQHGLSVPRTWFPDDDAALARVAREASFPLLVKPRTQMFLVTHFKGQLIEDAQTVAPAYRRFMEGNRYQPEFLRIHPGIDRPMLQEFHGEAADAIYSISGFIDRSGELFVTRACRKVLQRPRRVGVGLCFEGAHVEEKVATGLQALCRGIGYFGVFEVEFICRAGQHLLIDFNPRFYNQMAFDIARGMPLPLLVWQAACGEHDALAREVAKAREAAGSAEGAFCNRFALSMLLTMRSLARRSDAAERRRWRDWLLRSFPAVVDAVSDPEDRVPAFVDAVNQVVRALRHPRAYLRNAVLD